MELIKKKGTWKKIRFQKEKYKFPLEECKIKIEEPLFCMIEKFLDYNEDEHFITLILSDYNNQKHLGFLYGDFVEIILPVLQQKPEILPIKISILKGDIKQMSQDKYYIEIYHVIFQNYNFINASSFGPHEFCSMQSYMNHFIFPDDDPNIHLLWGNLIHDYLANFYQNCQKYKNLLNSKNQQEEQEHDIIFLEKGLIAAFEKACYANYGLIYVLEEDINDLINQFKDNFLRKESQFFIDELHKYNEKYQDYQFICEKMIYSRHLGIQGRIDRLIQNFEAKNYTLYETKTGYSSDETLTKAYYQCTTYATMLSEYYPSEVDLLCIEFPKNNLEERLVEKTYDKKELTRVIKNRNEIWKSSLGFRPETGPYDMCARCFTKSACEFYCYRTNHDKYCKKHSDKCQVYKFFHNNSQNKLIFELYNAYFSWFSFLLTKEQLENFKIMNQLHSPISKEQNHGNSIRNLKITNVLKDNIENDEIILHFEHIDDENIGKTRMRERDYIIITPENYLPLTAESVYGKVIKISEKKIQTEISLRDYTRLQNHSYPSFRIDLTTSNYMIRLQKKAIDSFIRDNLLEPSKGSNKLRQILFFKQTPRIKQIGQEIKEIIEKYPLDKSQKGAIEKALSIQDILLIQGPPGTGKTTVITYLVKALLMKEKINKSNEKHLGLKKYLNKYTKDFSLKIPILLTAYTNQALDNIIGKLISIQPHIKLVRLGTSSSKNKKIKNLTLERKCSNQIQFADGTKNLVQDPKKIKNLLQDVDIIAATTTMTGNIILKNIQFDFCILDEAGQVAEPSALLALLKAKKYILVGDHLQLPPISSLEIETFPEETEKFAKILNFSLEKGLRLSIFERLIKQYKQKSSFKLLSFQYRMNLIINDFISKKFYDNKLKCGIIDGESIGERCIENFYADLGVKLKKSELDILLKQAFSSKNPMIFFDYREKKEYDSKDQKQFSDLDSKFNQFEVEFTTNLLSSYIQIIYTSIKSSQLFDSIIKNIGVISPYRAQNSQIKQKLTSNLMEIFSKLPEFELKNELELFVNTIIDLLEIDTVDRFQGNEKEIIIYNFVDSNKKQELSNLHLDFRRLNVSISRAKSKIIFVGNSKTLVSKKQINDDKEKYVKTLYNDLIVYIKKNEGYVPLE